MWIRHDQHGGARSDRAVGYPFPVPSLFRRRSTEAVAVEATEELTETLEPAELESPSGKLPRGYTPSKKERGLATPKRPSPHVRRPGGTPNTKARGQMTKEERREAKEERKAQRREITEGMRRGDPRYLAARDQGPEKAIARDVVDSRRTVGTWFFGGAFVVLLGSSSAVPIMVLIANMIFMLLAVALIIDSTILCRRIKRLVKERHPDTTVRWGSLYLYSVMRAITFRRLRIPLPRVKIGESV
jgi:hypothetical protein